MPTTSVTHQLTVRTPEPGPAPSPPDEGDSCVYLVAWSGWSYGEPGDGSDGDGGLGTPGDPGTVLIPWPDGIQDGDLAVFVTRGYTSAGNTETSIYPGAGEAQQWWGQGLDLTANCDDETLTATAIVEARYHTCDGTEEGITAWFQQGPSAATQHMFGAVFIFRNVDTTGPAMDWLPNDPVMNAGPFYPGCTLEMSATNTPTIGAYPGTDTRETTSWGNRTTPDGDNDHPWGDCGDNPVIPGTYTADRWEWFGNHASTCYVASMLANRTVDYTQSGDSTAEVLDVASFDVGLTEPITIITLVDVAVNVTGFGADACNGAGAFSPDLSNFGVTFTVENVTIGGDPELIWSYHAQSIPGTCESVVTPVPHDLATISGRPALLCADYGVMIIDRRNRATVLRLPERGWKLSFNRRLDRPSSATLTVDTGGDGQQCCEGLGRVGEWMHELVVFRQGNRFEVWGGPITMLRDKPGSGQTEITAYDRSIWWGERALPYDLNYATDPQDAARVFVDLVRAADGPRSIGGVSNSGSQLLPYDPVGLEITAYHTGVTVDQKVLLQADDVIIGDEIRSLADAVLDYTVIGRRCYVGGLVVNLLPIPILTQDHWVAQDAEIERQGLGVATKVVVRGGGTVRGEYPPGQIVTPRWSQYGSHFKKIRDSSITDEQVAAARARSEWERWQQPTFNVVTASGTLGPKAPVTVEDLIPGRSVQIAITEGCLPTSLRLGETRAGGRVQYYAFDTGALRPLIVAQRLLEVSVTVEDSMETEVKIDTQALGTAVARRVNPPVTYRAPHGFNFGEPVGEG